MGGRSVREINCRVGIPLDGRGKSLRQHLILSLLALIAMVSVACGETDPSPVPTATGTPRPVITPVPPPNSTVTPVPTLTPNPPVTPVSTPTSTSNPTGTPNTPSPQPTFSPRRVMTYEYAAKIVCGIQEDPANMRLVIGNYATAINIHNPNRGDVAFIKKLALTFPPEEQRLPVLSGQGQVQRRGVSSSARSHHYRGSLLAGAV